MPMPPAAPPTDAGNAAAWTPLHDLALVYFTLAFGTDLELSPNERHMMQNKLCEWTDEPDRERVLRVLDDVSRFYAGALDDGEGIDPDVFNESARNVRDVLTIAQRQAALTDLLHLANADGVFLESEEDLINFLVMAWDVPPETLYGRKGSKR